MTQHFIKHAEWPRKHSNKFDCVFMDPPDNIGLQYKDSTDNISAHKYGIRMFNWLSAGIDSLSDTGTMWVSFNSQYTLLVARMSDSILQSQKNLTIKTMVQTFTFGQHSQYDFGNNHRPLWRFQKPDAKVYTDQIRCESVRQKQGDKRADPHGRVPSDVFDFPRVVGNSRQRRSWHPTQLGEGLVERCIKSCTLKDDWVLDVFSGTGTALRVCKSIGRNSVSVESSLYYCTMIAAEHDLEVLNP